MSSRVIVALDFADSASAQALVERLRPQDCRLKVGFELFVSAGPSFVSALVDKGFDVFLDLKFHDIPNTVASVCTAASRLGVWMINVHASGGIAMLEAARAGVDAQTHRPKLIAVTVLTSMDDEDLKQIGLHRSAQEQALALAELTQRCGLDGVVCSAIEAPAMRQAAGPDFILVTPGIRPEASQAGDQKRVMGPAEAVRAGSDYLVIGRPITKAADPVQVLSSINATLKLLT